MTDSTELTIFEQAYQPVDLFVPDASKGILAYVRSRVEAEQKKAPADITTEEGRKAIKSLAFKVVKSKTAIEDARVELVKAEKERLKKIDAEGKLIRDGLEALADEIRKPVTDFEDREKTRIDAHQNRLNAISALAVFSGSPSTGDLEALLAAARGIDPGTFEEFLTLAAGAKALTIEALTKRLELSRQADADRAELDRLRQERAEREQKDREAQIAAAARKQAEDAAAAALKRAEDDKAAAEQRVKDAERRAEEERQASARRAEEARLETARQVEAAAQAERTRIAQETEAAAQAERLRERDKVHKKKINNEACAALVKIDGITADLAKEVVTAIAKGLIPGVKISY